MRIDPVKITVFVDREHPKTTSATETMQAPTIHQAIPAHRGQPHGRVRMYTRLQTKLRPKIPNATAPTKTCRLPQRAWSDHTIIPRLKYRARQQGLVTLQ